MSVMSMKIWWAVALMVAGGVASPAGAKSCGLSIDVVNHRSEPVKITLKWFYGERPVRPDVTDFREVDLQELQANGLASSLVMELSPNASQRLDVRTICGGVSNDYLNWRYSLDGVVFSSGQLDIAAEPWPYELHVR